MNPVLQNRIFFTDINLSVLEYDSFDKDNQLNQ